MRWLPPWTLRGRLHKERERIAHDVTKRLLDSPDAYVLLLPWERRRLRLHSTLLRALHPRFERIAAFAVATASLLLAVALSQIHVPRAQVVATIQTDTAAFRLADNWTSDVKLSLADNTIHLDRLSELISPALFDAIKSTPGTAWMNARGKRIWLEHLDIAPTTWLEIERRGEIVHLYIKGSARGRLSFSDQIGATLGAHERRVDTRIPNRLLEVPESIEFSARGVSIVPMTFRVAPDGSWTLRDLIVSAVDFSKEVSRAPGETSFQSGITSGVLRLYQLDESFDLAPHDALSFENFVGRVVEVKGEQRGNIHVTLNGTATKVLRGFEHVSKDLTPTLLKYVYHQKTNLFFVLAIASLWSLLWGVRKAIFS